ncbi:toprim domain-containing protein [Stenotrophomonas sp. PE591]|uniref:toprim domain-containing protein n=1 Tax=Stenotrophomonas sp. PE591 TaxID=1812490 RepID=UPI0031BACE2C
MQSADSEYLHKEPCPNCGSKDNLARYSDGHGYCFGCGHYEPAEGEEVSQPTSRKTMSDFAKGEPQALAKRGITEEACRKYGYWIGKDKHGKTVQIANYKRDGGIVAQKLRYPDKKFSFIGDSKACGLFGQHLYEPGRRLVITEGEIDALSVAQALGLRWPVVSVPNGAQGAAKSIKRELEWVNGFDEVVLMFDMDEPGQAAAQEVALLLTPGKAKIAQLPAKDPNELLQRGDAEAITRAIYEAQTKRPDGVVTFGSLKEKALKPVSMGMPWHDPRLTALTYGKRYGEVYTFGAGTGIGKTDWLMEEAAFIAQETGDLVGLFFLEQQPVETAKRMAGKVAGRRFHVPDGSWTQEELEAAFEILDKGQVFIYDHFGSSEWDVIEAKMAHMVVAEGVKHIVLDNLTSFAAGAEDERKMLEDTMAKIAQFAQRHLICIYLVSHLATPEGKPHEEGGRVMLRHFKGSRAIGFWTHFAFGLERNTQAENEAERNCTTFRVLKDRFTGQSNGQVLYYSYDHASGRLLNADAPGEYGDFADESSDVSTSDY